MRVACSLQKPFSTRLLSRHGARLAVNFCSLWLLRWRCSTRHRCTGALRQRRRCWASCSPLTTYNPPVKGLRHDALTNKTGVQVQIPQHVAAAPGGAAHVGGAQEPRANAAAAGRLGAAIDRHRAALRRLPDRQRWRPYNRQRQAVLARRVPHVRTPSWMCTIL